MDKINVLKPKYRTDEVLKEIKKCFDKSWTGMGFKTVEFEEAWKEYTKLPHAHFLQSNTVGLHLALNIFRREEGWEDGDEIQVNVAGTFKADKFITLLNRTKNPVIPSKSNL